MLIFLLSEADFISKRRLIHFGLTEDEYVVCVMFYFDFALNSTQTLDLVVLLNIAPSMVDFYRLGKSRETIRNDRNCAG